MRATSAQPAIELSGQHRRIGEPVQFADALEEEKHANQDPKRGQPGTVTINRHRLLNETPSP
jgi:hypothetical protein